MKTMKTILMNLAAAAAMAAAAGASASVTQVFGSGAAAPRFNLAADFTANTALSSNYSEGGLLFSYTGSAGNNGCGYAGVDCYDSSSELGAAFSGNYMATAGSNAYVGIRRANGGDMLAIEFAAGTGYLNLNGYWQTYDDGMLTGSGNFSQSGGVVLGLADSSGFDEVRYFAFSSTNKIAGYSAPAIDTVQVLAVPEPAAWLMLGGGLGVLWLQRRRRRRVLKKTAAGALWARAAVGSI
jgi:hypothetical protein